MLIFFRSWKGPSGLSVRATRGRSLLSLGTYPAGAFILALLPKSSISGLVGYGLVVIALVSVAPLTGSSLQRIVGEHPSKLDEYELQLRSRAMSYSYGYLTVIVLLAIIYAALAKDFGGWLPSTYDHFNGLFWGAFLYASVIPVAALSWIVDQTFEVV